jgi:hypothetical protein
VRFAKRLTFLALTAAAFQLAKHFAFTALVGVPARVGFFPIAQSGTDGHGNHRIFLSNDSIL